MYVHIYQQNAKLILCWILSMITTKTIKWLIWSFINKFEHKQQSNSAYQSSIPISNFEYVFAYWKNKADPYLCFVQGY